MKYAAINDYQAEFPVSRLCAVLNVAESGYYAWLKQVPSAHQQENRELEQTICTIWKQYRGIYGAPRIHAELQEQGIKVGHNRVARLMRHAGIQGKTVCKRRPAPLNRIQATRWQPIDWTANLQSSDPMQFG